MVMSKSVVFRLTVPKDAVNDVVLPCQIPNFQNFTFCELDLKDNKHDSLHLALKYAQIFVLTLYLSRCYLF